MEELEKNWEKYLKDNLPVVTKSLRVQYSEQVGK